MDQLCAMGEPLWNSMMGIYPDEIVENLKQSQDLKRQENPLIKRQTDLMSNYDKLSFDESQELINLQEQLDNIAREQKERQKKLETETERKNNIAAVQQYEAANRVDLNKVFTGPSPTDFIKIPDNAAKQIQAVAARFDKDIPSSIGCSENDPSIAGAGM